MYQCNDCDRCFNSIYQLNSHKRVHKSNYNKHAGYNLGAGKNVNIRFNARCEVYYSKPKQCKQCDTTLEYNKRYRTFCSQSCAATYSNLHRGPIQKQPQKKSRRVYPKKNIICEFCKITFTVSPHKKQRFCSHSCCSKWKHSQPEYKIKMINAGKKSAQVQSSTRRSRNEIHFANKCIEHFSNVVTNVAMFNGWDADIILPDIKVAVLWNGVWHYQKITKTHSVSQVQNRDRIKMYEIENMGFFAYVIKDPGKENINFVLEEFNKFLSFLEHYTRGEIQTHEVNRTTY